MYRRSSESKVGVSEGQSWPSKVHGQNKSKKGITISLQFRRGKRLTHGCAVAGHWNVATLASGREKPGVRIAHIYASHVNVTSLVSVVTCQCMLSSRGLSVPVSRVDLFTDLRGACRRIDFPARSLHGHGQSSSSRSNWGADWSWGMPKSETCGHRPVPLFDLALLVRSFSLFFVQRAITV